MFNIRDKKTGLLMKEIDIKPGEPIKLEWTSSRGDAARIPGCRDEKQFEGWKDFQKKMGVELELVEA